MLASFGCMVFAYRYSEKLSQVAFEETVESGIPEFLSRISLLLNAGMILQAIFEKLAMEGKNADSRLMRDFSRLYDASAAGNGSVINGLRQYAAEHGSRELLRLCGIFGDNLTKGTELAGRLDTEVEILWHTSKKSVEERGRLAETKLSFPMGLMLIVVILITTAPALMSL